MAMADPSDRSSSRWSRALAVNGGQATPIWRPADYTRSIKLANCFSYSSTIVG